MTSGLLDELRWRGMFQEATPGLDVRLRSEPPTWRKTSKATALCSDSSSACHSRIERTSVSPSSAWASGLRRSVSASVAV